MKPPPFEYRVPDRVEEALEVLAESGYDARPLAGGQSLVPMLNFRLARPSVLVDLNRIEALFGCEDLPDGGVRIGAMTRQADLERLPRIHEAAPLLAAAAAHVAHPPIRNRGTLGGSLAHADPAAELPTAALALDAAMLVRGPGGERRVAAADFFLAPFATGLAPEELLVAVEFPRGSATAGWAFEEVARRRGDYALAAAAVVVELAGDDRIERARIALVNAADRPLSAAEASAALVGQPASAGAIAAAAEIAATRDADPPADVHASAAYRRRLVRVTTRRALERAVAAAREKRQQV